MKWSSCELLLKQLSCQARVYVVKSFIYKGDRRLKRYFALIKFSDIVSLRNILKGFDGSY
ncbi:hypothetical protein U14_00819 [Candidatus Moduliflexus flocculans]|uniref:Uncharacterized protein n=1 Tax=Candidatus Moduliflexus flocculans TaxID=1499966 RepID=A0A0S6VV69_9BACT|nr:hypothetical protein U14_00819 [Candidatus Moduliflexus flocculans]